jgi:16S rRNA (guanine527-N7)-methyltransferase
VTQTDVLNYVRERVAESGISVSGEGLNRIGIYFDLLRRWNGTVNLTGFDLETPTSAALDRLLVEPVVAAGLAVAGEWTSPASHLIDIGSGGGSPAIPFALAAELKSVTLVESRVRKSVFLREAIRTVALDGQVLVERLDSATALDAGRQFDVLTIRAVRVDGKMLGQLLRLVTGGGRLLFFRREAAVNSGAEGAVDPLAALAGIENLDTFTLLKDPPSHLAVLRKRPSPTSIASS